MSILKELNELAAKYSEDYEKESTIEGAINAFDASLENTLKGIVETFRTIIYGEGRSEMNPAEGSILYRIVDLENRVSQIEHPAH